MGYNSSTFNLDADLDSKSIKELQDSLVYFEKFVEDNPKFEYGWANEYIHLLRLKIAERVGKATSR